MSLKDFAIINKLGKTDITQGRELIQVCTKCRGMLTGRSTL